MQITKILTLLYPLAILQSLAVLITAILPPAPGIYIDRLSFGTLISTPFSQVVGGYNTSINWRYSLPGIVYYGITPYSFRLTNSNAVLSYKVELFSIKTTNAILNMNPIGTNSDINYIAFTIIIITQNLPYLQLLPVTSSSISFDPVSGGFYTGTLSVTSSKFIFQPPSTVQIRCFRQWFTVVYSLVLNLTKIQLVCLSVSSTSNIEVKVTSDSPSYLSGIKVFVLAYETAIVYPNVLKYVDIGLISSISGVTSFTNNFGIDNDVYGSPVSGFNCIIGSGTPFLNISVNQGPFDLIIAQNSDEISHFDNQKIEAAHITAICLVQCPFKTFVGSQPNVCLFCRDNIRNCVDCLSENYCINCAKVSFLSEDNRACFLCTDFIEYCIECTNSSVCLTCSTGNEVVGGCSTVPGCIEVQQVATSEGNKGLCLQCDPFQFQLNILTRQCDCKDGKILAGQHCTDVIGCISSQRIGDTVFCTFCSHQSHFQIDLSMNTCVCVDGFEMKDDQCRDICGDGKVITAQCDDGNLIDGDGCSSTCQIQNFHICFKTSNSSPSTCQYRGPILDITLTNTQKTPSQNQGVFIFSFNPPLPLLDKFDLMDYFYFSINDSSYQAFKWTYSDGKATVYVNYQIDLESKSALVNFTFHQPYIRHVPIIIQFTIKSDGAPLIASKKTIGTITLKYILLSAACLSIFVLLFGSWVQKMVGVQVINFLQMIYFLHFTVPQYTSVWSNFQQLSLVAFNGVFIHKAYTPIILYPQYEQLAFTIEESQESTLCISLILISVFLLYLILQAILHFRPQTSKTLGLFVENYYHYLIFPLSLSLMIPLFLLTTTYSFHNLPQETTISIRIRSLLIFLTIFFISLVFAYQLKNLFFRQSKRAQIDRLEKRKRFYIPIYQIYIFFQLFLIVIWVQMGAALTFYPFFLLSLLMIFWQIKVKPYELFLDNFSIFMNQAFLCLYHVILLLRDRKIISLSFENDILICLFIGVLIIICLALSTIRVIRGVTRRLKICQRCRNNEVDQEQIKKKAQKRSNKTEPQIRMQMIKNRSNGDFHFLSFVTQGSENKRSLIETVEEKQDDVLVRMKGVMRRQFREGRKNQKSKVGILSNHLRSTQDVNLYIEKQ